MKHQIFVAGLILVASFVSTALQGQTLFSPEQAILGAPLTPQCPTSIHINDLDNDGDLDIITGSAHDNKVAWFENDGAGNFSWAKRVREYSNEGSVEVYSADLDDDGFVDIVATNNHTDEVTWHRNAGNGSFDEEVVIMPALTDPNTLYVDDLNGDGFPDVISGSVYDQKIMWYSNEGDGNFSSNPGITIDADGDMSITSADLNGDTFPDLIATTYRNDHVYYYPNDGFGNFGDAVIISSTSYRVRRARASDLDGDGDLDILTATYEDDKIAWFANDGAGNFGPEQIIVQRTSPAMDVYAADIDNDGDQDVVSGYQFSGEVAWFANDGNGQFSEVQVISTISEQLRRIVVADFNNDDNVDVVSASCFDDRLAWYENEGMGVFNQTHTVSNSLEYPSSMKMVDLDNDGDEDVLATGQDHDLVVWQENVNGTFEPYKIITNQADRAYDAIAADLDNDGDLDVVSVSGRDDKVAWYANDGNTNFGDQQILTAEGGEPFEVGLADLDGNGFLDIVYASKDVEGILWIKNNGNVNFDEPTTIYSDPSETSFVHYVALPDLDSDGDIDIVTNGPGNVLVWYANDGLGNFTDYQVVSEESVAARDVFVADLDGDLDLDILATAVAGRVTWYRNDGQQNFNQEDDLINDLDQSYSVHAADLDNDGDLDAVYCSIYDGNVGWSENDGTGDFGSANILSQNIGGAIEVGSSDIDDDGDLDIVAVAFYDHTLVFFENFLTEEVMTISGQIYWDKDDNGSYSHANETLPAHAVSVEPSGYSIHADETGTFTFYTNAIEEQTMSVEDHNFTNCIGVQPLSVAYPVDYPFHFQVIPGDTIEQDFYFTDTLNDCNTLSGVVFNDENSNGIQDVGEVGLSGIPILVNSEVYVSTILINSDVYVYTHTDGSYSLQVANYDSVTLSVNLSSNVTNYYCGAGDLIYTQTYPADNADYEIAVEMADITAIDFGLHSDGDAFIDVGVYALSVQYGNEAGEIFRAWMDFKSFGPITEPCSLRIEHSPLVEMNLSSIIPSSQSYTHVEWIFPPGSAPSAFCMEMEWEVDSSAVAGDTLHWKATYECPPLLDGCPENNSIARDVLILSGPLRQGSYEELKLYSFRPEGAMPFTISNEEGVFSFEIHYTNPWYGVADTFNIYMFLPDYFDLSTISKPFSSFPGFDFSVVPSGFFGPLLKWETDFIGLADLTVEEVNSYGFVQFNVRLKPDLLPGTFITSSAYILRGQGGWWATNEDIHQILDTVPPMAVCHEEVSLFLDEDGEVDVQPVHLDNGSSDNSHVINFDIDDEDEFTCSDLNGRYSIELIVEDESQNSSSCVSHVEILDSLTPIIECQGLEMSLTSGAFRVVELDELLLSATDNCGFIHASSNLSTFTSYQEGPNEIVIEVVDGSGNISTCVVNVEVMVVTAVEEFVHGLEGVIEPNPFSDKTGLLFTEAPPFYYDLKLVDILGRECQIMRQVSGSTITIHRKDLPEGIYFLSMYESGASEILATWKLIVK